MLESDEYEGLKRTHTPTGPAHIDDVVAADVLPSRTVDSKPNLGFPPS